MTDEEYNLIISYKNGSRKEQIIILKELEKVLQENEWGDIKDIKLERRTADGTRVRKYTIQPK